MLLEIATPPQGLGGCHRLVTTDLETERLLLRRPVAGDAAAIARIANDRRIAEMTRLPFPYRIEHAASFVANLPAAYRGMEAAWLIEHLGEPVGMAGFSSQARPALELGYWIATHHQGHGFATEAAQAVLNAAFCRLQAETVSATARVANSASRNVLEKCGFVWTDCVLQRSETLGCSVPVDRFRLTRSTWAAHS